METKELKRKLENLKDDTRIAFRDYATSKLALDKFDATVEESARNRGVKLSVDAMKAHVRCAEGRDELENVAIETEAEWEAVKADIKVMVVLGGIVAAEVAALGKIAVTE